MCPAQGPQQSDASEARPLGLESSTEPLRSLQLVNRVYEPTSRELSASLNVLNTPPGLCRPGDDNTRGSFNK